MADFLDTADLLLLSGELSEEGLHPDDLIYNIPDRLAGSPRLFFADLLTL